MNPQVFTNASGHYVDTETTVSVGASQDGNKGSAFVTVRYVGNLQWWEQPTATKLRSFVDTALKGTGLKRDGARVELQSDINGTRYLYPLKRA